MNMKNMRRAMDDFDVDDVLELIGLERRRTTVGIIVPMVGLLAAGVAIGAGLGLFLAPTSGRELRREAEGKMSDIKERLRGENDVQPTMTTP
jgi:YtxH-like protein